VSREYLRRGQLDVRVMGRGMAWIDTGTHEVDGSSSPLHPALEKRQGMMVACPEEIAYRSGYITAAEGEKIGSSMRNSSYGAYLLSV